MRKIFTFLCAALMSVGMWAEPITVTWTRADILHKGSGNSFTKDGVTVTCGGIDWNYPDFSGNGTFTTDLGIVKYHFEVAAGKENFEWITL